MNIKDLKIYKIIALCLLPLVAALLNALSISYILLYYPVILGLMLLIMIYFLFITGIYFIEERNLLTCSESKCVFLSMYNEVIFYTLLAMLLQVNYINYFLVVIILAIDLLIFSKTTLIYSHGKTPIVKYVKITNYLMYAGFILVIFIGGISLIPLIIFKILSAVDIFKQ